MPLSMQCRRAKISSPEAFGVKMVARAAVCPDIPLSRHVHRGIVVAGKAEIDTLTASAAALWHHVARNILLSRI